MEYLVPELGRIYRPEIGAVLDESRSGLPEHPRDPEHAAIQPERSDVVQDGDGDVHPPDHHVGEGLPEASLGIGHDGEQIDERRRLVAQLVFEILVAIDYMRVGVGPGIVIIVMLGIELLLEEPLDLGEILVPDPDVHVIVPGDEAVVPDRTDGRTVAQIVPYPVGIEDAGDVLVHREQTGLGVVHRHCEGCPVA